MNLLQTLFRWIGLSRVVVFALAVNTVGCGGSAGDPAGSVVERTFEVLPHRFVEANVWLSEAATARAEFDAEGSSVSWDVHTHHGMEVRIHQGGEGQEGRIPLEADWEGEFSFRWTNTSSAPVRLSVRVFISEGSYFRSWSVQ